MKAPKFYGIELGTPWKLNDYARGVVVPILLAERHGDRNYKLYLEVEDAVSITDGGSISESIVRNKTDEYVFFRKGTIFQGKTQERAVIHSVAVAPNSRTGIPVRCIHASKGILAGTPFWVDKTYRYVPNTVLYSLSAGQTHLSSHRLKPPAGAN